MDRPKIKNYKDLEVWQEAKKLSVTVYNIAKKLPQSETKGLYSQVTRNAVSVQSNIAEGFAKESYKDKLHFYTISRGSLLELENQIELCKDLLLISEEDYSLVTKQITIVHKLLNAFIAKTRSFIPNSKFQIPHSNKAFTLVEMLIVLAMVAIISTVTVVNFRIAEKQKQIGYTADGVVSALRNAQNLTLTSKQIIVSACADKAPKEYQLQIDLSSTAYNLVAVDNCSNTVNLETYKLQSGTRFRANSAKLCNPVCNSGSILRIKFVPPFAAITGTVNNPNAFLGFTTAEVIVESTDAQRSKIIKIDGLSGKIGL